MSADLEDLERKIQELRSAEQPSAQKTHKKSNERAGMQAGLEFALCIGLGAFLGFQLDQWLGTTPAFMIVLFFLGVASGFWTLYKYSRRTASSIGFSQLPEPQKSANKTPDNSKSKE